MIHHCIPGKYPCSYIAGFNLQVFYLEFLHLNSQVSLNCALIFIFWYFFSVTLALKNENFLMFSLLWNY